MQRAQKAPLPLDPARQRASRTAWAILFIAFLICCTLGSSLAYAGWRYRLDATTAPRPVGQLIVRSPAFSESVTWTERGTTNSRIATNGQPLNEGDSVAIPRTAGSPYGQVASVRLFDQTQLDLWAGADVGLAQSQISRWSGEQQQVTLLQRSGYVRYDLKDGQPFREVLYRVMVGDAEVLMQPGGSYSVDITQPDRLVARLGQFSSPPLLGDVAVRSGQLVVRGGGNVVTVLPGQRVSLDPAGTPGPAVPARWDVLADSRFGEYTEQQYNNTTLPDPDIERSGTWLVTSQRKEEGAVPNGYFRVYAKCLPLGSPSGCTREDQINVANFQRDGGQTAGFLTGVRQIVNKDVTEYRSLRLSLKLRLLNQSLSVGGLAGAECPVVVKLIYKETSPVDTEQQVVYCFYYRDDPGEELRAGEIKYHQAPQYDWFKFEDELRASELREARFIQEIQIYADGHDYNAEVTDISLIGSQ